jgi:hypothetical protein
MKEAARASETSVNFYRTTRRNKAEDSHCQSFKPSFYAMLNTEFTRSTAVVVFSLTSQYLQLQFYSPTYFQLWRILLILFSHLHLILYRHFSVCYNSRAPVQFITVFSAATSLTISHFLLNMCSLFVSEHFNSILTVCLPVFT